MPLTQEHIDSINAPYIEEAKRKRESLEKEVVVETTIKEVSPTENVKVETVEKKADAPEAKSVENKLSTQDLIDKLKEEGIDVSSLDEIKELKSKASRKPISEEEIKANLIEFAVKQKNMKVEDFMALEELKKTSDYDVAYKEFAEKQKVRNSELTDEDIKKRFDKKFGDVKINDDGDEVIVYDKNDLSEYATEIRNKKSQPIEGLKKEYDSFLNNTKAENDLKAETENLLKNIPKSAKVKDGEKDYELNFDLATTEMLRNQVLNTYRLFVKNNGDKSVFKVDEVIQNAIWNDPKLRNDALTLIKDSHADTKVSEAL